MIVILHNRRTLPSAKVLVESLKNPILKKSLDAHLVMIGKPVPDEFIVNWGCTQAGLKEATLNRQNSVRLAVNKLDGLTELKNAAVSVPTFSTKHTELYYPMIARTPQHYGGRGLWLCHNEKDISNAVARGANHFINYIPDAYEFRVHIFRFRDKYRSIKLSEKIGGIGYIRSHKHGWRFIYPEHWTEAKLARAEAKKAVIALGLTFGAVDVLVKDNKPYVLEVNTAPALTDTTADTVKRYAEKIRWVYENEEYHEDSYDRGSRHYNNGIEYS